MLEDYKSALRAGQRAYRARIARGQSPYLAVLDDVLKGVDIVAQEPLGLVEIPSDSLVGTKTSGRHTAFSYDFMPLLEPDTEFAAKWSNLCDAHLEEGIHTPIIAFEYMNRFYVQEGNKRVSVLKYYGAVKIPGTVTRLIPARTEDLENKIYYEFLDFYKLSKVNYVHFSKLGGYSKLQTLVCKASGEAWSEDDRLNFAAFYTMFHQQFEALGGRSLGLTTGDALLVYLSVYRYSDTYDATPAQVRQNLEKLWNEVKVLTEPHGVELSLEPPKSPAEPLLSKLNIFSPSKQPSELRVVFLHEYNAKISAWVRAHDEGRDALAKVFPDKVYISCYEDVNPEVDAEQILEEVAHNNADVVFATSVRMYNACLKVAAQHPKTRILNCSLNAPHPLVRTYYPRTYEVTYPDGRVAMPISEGQHQCELLLALVFPDYQSGWDASNDYSNADLLKNAGEYVISDRIPLYQNGVLYSGVEPDGTKPSTTTAVTTKPTPSTTTAASGSLGDVNTDGSVKLNDLVLLGRYLLGNAELSRQGAANADLNQDGKANGMDHAALRQMLAQS